ncbi:hypothetical protein SELMODRAFT_428172 [Selaginella moellendorffii]|uniref:Uncharacterized protein n=1 Tax=Selaginella moellendorffii TaxID=88036 RepID=D8T1Z6_SELML|nr:hypothetical protein SELMODRAFT_428172 [Selaginella moellendorffii]
MTRRFILFVIITALVRAAVSSISVQEGDLRRLTCFTAILSMNGDSSHKSNWWQFLPYLQSSSEQAFLGYLVSSFSGRNLTAEVAEKEHESEETIKSLGTIKITMWALGFVCLDDVGAGTCVKFTPVVIRAIPGTTKYGFFSLWEEQNGMLSNTVESKVLTLPNWNTHIERLSGMTLRSIDLNHANATGLGFCKGMELDPQTFNRNIIVLRGTRDLDPSTNFRVKTAPEVAGFDMSKQVVFARRPSRNLCLLGVDNSSSSNSISSSVDLRTTTTLVDILGSFMSHVKTSYIQAQNSALDLNHPASDFWVAAVALPSAFIAVVAAAVPFINLQLKLFRNLTRFQRWKTMMLCVSNSILSVASYSAVIAVTPAEIQRQRKFATWGLLADQVPITRRGLQVLVVVKAESVYKSGSLILAWCSTAFLVPLVAWMTFYRCKQVFSRRRLLKASGTPEDERILDLQAIEMSAVEQQRLERKLEAIRSLERRVNQLQSIRIYNRAKSLS